MLLSDMLEIQRKKISVQIRKMRKHSKGFSYPDKILWEMARIYMLLKKLREVALYYERNIQGKKSPWKLSNELQEKVFK